LHRQPPGAVQIDRTCCVQTLVRPTRAEPSQARLHSGGWHFLVRIEIGAMVEQRPRDASIGAPAYA
jgi:hypothetical protein